MKANLTHSSVQSLATAIACVEKAHGDDEEGMLWPVEVKAVDDALVWRISDCGGSADVLVVTYQSPVAPNHWTAHIADEDDIREFTSGEWDNEPYQPTGPEACPGCGCLPGDGVTDSCNHPDGCGYFKEVQ